MSVNPVIIIAYNTMTSCVARASITMALTKFAGNVQLCRLEELVSYRESLLLWRVIHGPNIVNLGKLSYA